MTNEELNQKVKDLVAHERKLTQAIVHYIAEVDRRKAYLAMNYPSLFDYLTKEIGYANGAAQRRIDAARLFQKVPEVSEKIKSGAINLSQINKVQMICRQLRKAGEKIEVSRQKEIIQRLENQGARQTDLILAQEFNIKIENNRTHIQKDESVRVDLTFSKEEMEIIEQARALLSNKTGGNLRDTIVEMARQVLKASEPKGRSPKLMKIKSTTTMGLC